ncbi:MAG: hypothetical protein GY854_06100 [Deltaproteobacteria bacterium]|nr:hypothetical protein [Deltaproteobacteria bacterium]
MSEIIICPSGLKGRVRKMKVHEARSFSNRRRNSKGDPMKRLFSSCWEETLDLGPYDFDDKRIDWSEVLLGDRLYALMGIRIETHGPEYVFSVTCQERDCRKRIEWELNLDELPVRMLSDENREVFQNGNRFEMTLPEADTRLWFKMLLGKDEGKLAKKRRGPEELDLSDLLSFRIVEIEGVDKKEKRRFIDDLSMSDADFLMDEFDRVDCGIDTAIEIECPQCMAVQEVELPFEQTFFMPGKRRMARRGRSDSFRE